MTIRGVSWRLAVWPYRTIWPTRDGWWCLVAALGLGFGAINTGTNLLYLLVCMLLGLIVVSGILSERSLRGLRFTAVVPDDVFAGRPAPLCARVVNRKRWSTSYSVTIEALGPDGAETRVYLPRLLSGEERLVTWETTFAARGPHPFPAIRISTKFPFGLFLKAGHVPLRAEILVFPSVSGLGPELRRTVGTAAPAGIRRRGRGHDLYNLRDYRPGDDPRLIHWRSSAKTGALTVRELEAETAVDTRLVLEGRSGDPDAVERGLSRAASFVVHLIRAGAAVELLCPGVFVPLGRGLAHQRRLLTALALWTPAAAGPARGGPRSSIREIRVRLG